MYTQKFSMGFQLTALCAGLIFFVTWSTDGNARRAGDEQQRPVAGPRPRALDEKDVESVEEPREDAEQVLSTELDDAAKHHVVAKELRALKANYERLLGLCESTFRALSHWLCLLCR